VCYDGLGAPLGLRITNYLTYFSALELESSAGSNPVARWVEAVQPWMPGNKEAEDSQETPDWTSRAKGEKQLSFSCVLPFDIVLTNDINQLWSSCLKH
jgi:hypothetical protein